MPQPESLTIVTNLFSLFLSGSILCKSYCYFEATAEAVRTLVVISKCWLLNEKEATKYSTLSAKLVFSICCSAAPLPKLIYCRWFVRIPLLSHTLCPRYVIDYIHSLLRNIPSWSMSASSSTPLVRLLWWFHTIRKNLKHEFRVIRDDNRKSEEIRSDLVRPELL